MDTASAFQPSGRKITTSLKALQLPLTGNAPVSVYVSLAASQMFGAFFKVHKIVHISPAAFFPSQEWDGKLSELCPACQKIQVSSYSLKWNSCSLFISPILPLLRLISHLLNNKVSNSTLLKQNFNTWRSAVRKLPSYLCWTPVV